MYSFKRAADDIAELARQLGAPQIILGGHDWGGAIVYRVYLHHPKLISHLIAVCTPYDPPQKTYKSTQQLVDGPLPQFGYQLQLASEKVEGTVKSREQIKMFLNALYGGKVKGEKGEQGEAFNPLQGLLFDKYEKLERSRLMTDEDLEYVTGQYARNGLHGPCEFP
jgi:soluble epoxide hydrolase / lipid-phosphate phosphatase